MSLGEPEYMSKEDKALQCYYRDANGYCWYRDSGIYCDPEKCKVIKE